jgi:hypothetical protein
MKQILLTPMMFMLTFALSGQNVGIGVENPQQKLSVDGSVVVDYNMNNNNNLDSFSLLFGHDKEVGIARDLNDGLRIYSGGSSRVYLSSNGNLGVGGISNNNKFYVLGSGYIQYLRSQFSHVGNSNYFNLAPHVKFQVTDGYSFFDGKVRINNQSQSSANFLAKGLSIFEGQTIIDTLRVNDNLGIGSSPGSYKLLLVGNGRINGDLGIGGDAGGYKFRVFGSGRIDGNFRVEDYFSIGGSVDENYRLAVKGGNSKFFGSVDITGTLTTANINPSSIKNKGVVTSNGSSDLRIGFDVVSFNTNIGGNNVVDLPVSISDFEVGAGNVRIAISQFVTDPHPNYADWSYITMAVHSVDPANDTCKVRLTNTKNYSVPIKGTLYLMSIAKD